MCVHSRKVHCCFPTAQSEHLICMPYYSWVRRFLREELGQDLVEYALLLTCVSLTVIVVMQSLGASLGGKYSAASAAVADAGAGTGARGGGNPGNPTPGAGTPGQGNPGGNNPGKGGGPGGKP